MTEVQESRWSGLLLQAQAGDKQAYEVLLQELAGLMRLYVGKRLFRPDYVEDVVQEILVSVHRAKHTFRQELPLAPWLYAIANRRVVDHLRVTLRIDGREIADSASIARAAEIASVPELSDPRAGRGEWMRQAMESLPASQREVVQLLKVEELSVKEIALRLGISESAVKVRAHRGYRRLRRMGERNDANQ